MSCPGVFARKTRSDHLATVLDPPGQSKPDDSFDLERSFGEEGLARQDRAEVQIQEYKVEEHRDNPGKSDAAAWVKEARDY